MKASYPKMEMRKYREAWGKFLLFIIEVMLEL